MKYLAILGLLLVGCGPSEAQTNCDKAGGHYYTTSEGNWSVNIKGEMIYTPYTAEHCKMPR